MRIYKMTATFGKLEHKTLTLEPGLNVITAPNEWGKSTWCAFLAAMLYGLDTRAKTTKTVLADKERYAPWSGAPMEGRIDLNWNGRDITIERRTKRRVPLGDFKAYETASGLPVTELTAANCGQMLLGVEQSVFRRSSFIRHADLPVTQDEALRRRLNALVTTGDESGAADRLAQTLKELKNRCRYNRTGLLPQAEAERDALENRLAELESLESQCRKLKQRIDETKDWITQLTNHRQALDYAQAQENARRAAQARDTLEAAEAELRRLEAICADLPTRQEAEQQQSQLRAYREQCAAARAAREHLPEVPEKPQLPEPFTDMDVAEAKAMAKADAAAYQELTGTPMRKILILMGIFGIAAAGILVFLKAYIFAVIAGVAGLAALVWGIFEQRATGKKVRLLEEKYGSRDYSHWGQELDACEEALYRYHTAREAYQRDAADMEARMQYLQQRREELCGAEDPETVLDRCTYAVENRRAYEAAQREAAQTKHHFEVLNAMVKPVQKPSQPDTLSTTAEETARLLTECAAEQQRLQNRLGQYQGRMETLGDPRQLRGLLEQKNKRILRLEETYAALTVAQETLANARAELQRRFAPRITKRAQKILSKMTDGRYQAMTMGEDLSLQARTGDEDTLHDAIWRSDGTMDQLYLALRLAVAEELTPGTPLILDDALVRFDDKRMAAAVDILEEMAQTRQVILFTCQGREARR